MSFFQSGNKFSLKAILLVCMAFFFASMPASETANSQQVIQKIEVLVNDEVISAFDVSQRMGLVLMATGQRIESQEQLVQLRDQVLEALIDEYLQNQEAAQFEVPVAEDDIRQAFARVAQGYNRTPDSFVELLAEFGSSPQAMFDQIRSEFAWQNLVNGRYSSQVSATDDEIDAVLQEMQDNVGRTEYRLSEIFLIVSNPAEEARVRNTAQQIRDRIQNFSQFSNVAQQFSQSTSAAQGGDVGWVSEGQFPDEIIQAVSSMDLLEVSQPIQTAGGYYIVGYSDRRRILTSDPLDEVVSLRQLSHIFTAETTEESAMAWYNKAIEEVKTVQACDQVPELASRLEQAEYRDVGEVALKQMNPQLREIINGLEDGQASEPLNTPDGFIIFAACGRRMPEPRLPSYQEIQQQIENQRLVMIARRYLRDLRRDAIIDYK